MKFKRSTYTVQAKLPDESLALLNTFTGAIVKISSQNVSRAIEILKGKEISSDDEALVSSLRKGGFIVDEHKNEYREFCAVANSLKYRTDELELIIMPTEQCNFRCIYCYENFFQPQMSESVQARIIKLFEKRLPFLRVFRSQWFGGEPLLAPDLVIELSSYFLQRCQEKEIRYESVMTTNGYYLDKSIAERLFLSGIRTFQITIDGSQKTHDKKRVLYGNKKGTYEVIMRNLLALKVMDEQFHVFVRCNVDRDNLNIIDIFLKDFKQRFGKDERFLVFARPVWGSRANTNLPLCDQKTSDRLPYEFGSKAVARGLNWYDGIKGLQFAGEVCYAAKPNSFVIGSDGTVYKCTSAFNLEANRVGQLDDQGNLNLNLGRYSLWIENFYFGESKCQSCQFLPICQGSSCPLNTIIDSTGIVYCPPGKQGIKKKLQIIASPKYDIEIQ